MKKREKKKKKGVSNQISGEIVNREKCSIK